jgi:hypothetical protein
MFRDYEERGDLFKKLVQDLAISGKNKCMVKKRVPSAEC